MELYHIDRRKSIQKLGKLDFAKIEFAPANFSSLQNISEHGVNWWIRSDCLNWSREYEILLEYLRISKYPQFPSRLQCLFAHKNKQTAWEWAKNNIETDGEFNLVTIEADNYYEFDYSWFTRQKDTLIPISHTYPVNSVFGLCDILENYWKGNKTNTPLIEALVPLPCTVKKIETLKTLTVVLEKE